MSHNPTINIQALKVHQWLAQWDEIGWTGNDHGKEPQHWFYMFSMPAKMLKALSGIYPRTTDRKSSAEDKGVQRTLDKERSTEIREFVRYGFPWSDLSEAKRKSGEFQDLRQPGWLPTAIVINILLESDLRQGKQIARDDLVLVKDSDSALPEIILPKLYDGDNWQHAGVPPFEVIDGQHRLWAFDDSELDGDFELPVVAFLGLDLRWQAYLFYTINIKPKKINASLAFDLYPLLRTQDWLNKFEGHAIYRETRSQELVDLLWSHPESPWYHRINMLGSTGQKIRTATQAAWVRSLMASFVKSWEAPKIGGLFGASVGKHQGVLPWSRTEQAAFLIVAGQKVRAAILDSKAEWAESLRHAESRRAADTDLFDDSESGSDPAYAGRHSLLNQDQGIRIFLQVINDLLFVCADKLNLITWGGLERDTDMGGDVQRVSDGIESLEKSREIVSFLELISVGIASYDWRSSDAPGLSDQQRVLKASFRGSGGYKELRRSVLRHLAAGNDDVALAAQETIGALGY